MEHFEDLFEKGKPPYKACLLSSAEMLLAMSKCSEFSTYQPFAVRLYAASVLSEEIQYCLFHIRDINHPVMPDGSCSDLFHSGRYLGP